MKVPFGKYKGHTLNYIQKHDTNYLNWLSTIELKEPFKSEYDKFFKNAKTKALKLEVDKVNDCMARVEKIASIGNPVYSVNVHGVGVEYRVYDQENRKMINVEEIMGDKYYICGELAVSKENYDKLYAKLIEYHDKTGKQEQMRGLY